VQTELLHDAAAVGVDRLDRDPHIGRDLTPATALADLV
jgi:hypothetical protein